MNNEQTPSVLRFPRVHKFFTSNDWSAASLVLAFATYLAWFTFASDFSSEQILSSTVVFIAVSGLLVVAAACVTRSWHVLVRGTVSWLIAGGAFAFVYLLLSFLAVNSQYNAKEVLEQYAQEVISERSSRKDMGLAPNEPVWISVNAVKAEIAQQKQFAKAVEALSGLDEELRKFDSGILSIQDWGEFGFVLDKRKNEFKARQIDYVPLLVRFVKYSRFVCKDVPQVSPDQPVDQVCSLKDMLDYGKSFPVKYPRWNKIMRWFRTL